MARAVKQFGGREFVQFIPAVKAVGLEMLPAVDAAVVGVLKEPSLEGTAVGIELTRRFENIQEDSLHGLFRFPIVAQDGPRDSEDERTMPLEQDCQGIVAAHAQSGHQVFISEDSKARGREESGCQIFIG
jgi:hypothetical protein